MKCSVRGCRLAAVIKKHQLCWPHAQRYYRYGTPGSPAVRVKRKNRRIEPFRGGSV